MKVGRNKIFQDFAGSRVASLGNTISCHGATVSRPKLGTVDSRHTQDAATAVLKSKFEFLFNFSCVTVFCSKIKVFSFVQKTKLVN